MGMRKPHFLLAMYASAERGRPVTMIDAKELSAKKPTRGNFSNYGNSLVAIYSLKSESTIWDTEETQNSKVMPRREHYGKVKSFTFEWTRTPRYGEPR